MRIQHRLFLLLGAALAIGAASPAFAQSNDDLDLDDILGPDSDESTEETVGEERRDVLEDDLSDQPGVDESALETPDLRRRIRPIKVLQPKDFLKIGRFEFAPGIGFVTNDPFVNVFLLNASVTYHATEIFGIEVSGIFSPAAPYKPITKQLVIENQVSPDVSRIQWGASATLMFSPIYGKVAIGENAIILEDHTKLAEVIVSIMQIREGADKKKVVDSWDGTTALAVRAATQNLTKRADVANGGVVTL